VSALYFLHNRGKTYHYSVTENWRIFKLLIITVLLSEKYGEGNSSSTDVQAFRLLEITIKLEQYRYHLLQAIVQLRLVVAPIFLQA